MIDRKKSRYSFVVSNFCWNDRTSLTVRYYCLKNEPIKTEREVKKKFPKRHAVAFYDKIKKDNRTIYVFTVETCEYTDHAWSSCHLFSTTKSSSVQLCKHVHSGSRCNPRSFSYFYKMQQIATSPYTVKEERSRKGSLLKCLPLHNIPAAFLPLREIRARVLSLLHIYLRCILLIEISGKCIYVCTI